MACDVCGQNARNHRDERSVYIAGQGWILRHEYHLPDLQTAFVHSNGTAIKDKFYLDTKAFRDRAVRDAAAKARKV